MFKNTLSLCNSTEMYKASFLYWRLLFRWKGEGVLERPGHEANFHFQSHAYVKNAYNSPRTSSWRDVQLRTGYTFTAWYFVPHRRNSNIVYL